MALEGIIDRLPAPVRAKLKSGSLVRFVWSLGAAVFGRIGLLIIGVIVARKFGAEAFGSFTFATGLALILGQSISLGLPMLMNREIPRMIVEDEMGDMRGLLRFANALTIVAASLVSLALWYLAPSFGKLADGIALTAILTPPLALTVLRRQQLAALQLSHLGLFFDQGFGAMLAAAMMLIIGAISFELVGPLYALGMGVAALITSVILYTRVPSRGSSAKPKFRILHWLKSAFPMMLGNSSKRLIAKSDVLLLAPLSTLVQTGLYGAAFRLTYVISFPQVVLMTVLTPLYSEAIARGQRDRLMRLFTQSIVFSCATIAPVLAVGLIFPEVVIGLIFGDEFVEAALTLQILLIGQVANSLALVFSSILVMGGREKLYALVNLVSLLVTAVLCIALIPGYGAFGAAIATAIATWGVLIAQVGLSLPILRTGKAYGSGAPADDRHGDA